MDSSTLLSEIDTLQAKLGAYRPLTTGETAHLRDNFIIDLTYHSAAIEGNTLTLEETALILRHDIATGGKSIKDHMEIVGHRNAYIYVEDLVREKVPITESIIQKLHNLVLIDRPLGGGAYRIQSPRATGSRSSFPLPNTVPAEMGRLLYEYKANMLNLHPIERAALFHLRFNAIQPFAERNGMTGRLLLNLELMQCGYLPICIQHQDIDEYQHCLNYQQAEGEAQPTQPMIAFVANHVRETLEQRIELMEVANDPAHGQHNQTI